MGPGEFENVSGAILALFPPLPESEQRVALALYRLLAERGAVSHEELARAAGISPEAAGRTLSSWPGVYRGGDGRIVGYGGLTVSETRHRMRICRHTRYAWCAWDTLFIPELLNATAQVESTCPATGECVTLTVHAHGIEPAGEAPAVSLLAPERTQAAADIVRHFCCHVQFFASEVAGRQWVAKRPGMFLATLDQAWQLGRRRNAQRYPMVRA